MSLIPSEIQTSLSFVELLDKIFRNPGDWYPSEKLQGMDYLLCMPELHKTWIALQDYNSCIQLDIQCCY